MPVNGVNGAGGVTGVTGTGSGSGALGCSAFKNDPTLAKIATGGAPPIAKGAPKSDTVKTMQTALYSLGYIDKRTSLDGAFGPGTEGAVKAFQAKAGVAQSGKLDANTLQALDKASSAQIATLQKQSLPDGSKRSQFKIMADISDPTQTRLYVIGKDNKIAARYLTSPGSAAFPTAGTNFTVSDALPRQPWNPPASGWAAKAKQVPPGIDNPMGIMKLSLGQYAEYIHGIPAGEEAELGHAASHGCLRVSGSNILELSEKYAEAGTQVTVNRDKNVGAQLRQEYQDEGVQDRPTTAGREYMFGYLSGELGHRQHYSPPPGA
jgi:lipoprotein-anchoring transpeptidase ErfK/SrfK